MLVLTRGLNEKIKIGNDVFITVVGVSGGQQTVRLGITAPSGVEILRTELYDTAAAQAIADAKLARRELKTRSKNSSGRKRQRARRPILTTRKRIPRMALGDRAPAGDSSTAGAK